MQPVARLFLVLLLVGFLPNNSTFAESRSETQTTERTLISQLQQQTGGLRIERHAETGKVRFLAAAPGQPIKRPRSFTAAATPAQAARSFLSSYGTLFGLRSQVDEVVKTGDLTVGSRSFVRFQQRYQGVPVFGGELVVQTDGQRNVVTANGEVLPDITLDTTPRISVQQAQEQARAAVAQVYKLAANQLVVSQPQLSIFNPALLGGPGLRVTRLTWRVEVRSASAGTPLRELALVDARNGGVVLRFNQIASAKERYICDQKNVRDTDYDPDNNCQSGNYILDVDNNSVADVKLAYEYSGATYDYFFKNVQRDSIDGNGMPLISLVRYCFPNAPGYTCPYNNAFWDGKQMTYGAGFAAADDVVGHELAHGITERTSNLFYYYQSGAINEAMSDIFGELIDLSYKGASDNDSASVRWQIGEDMPIGAIRDMRNPNAYGQPERMTDSAYYDADESFQDNGGVHTNSGVANKAAYLIADGETFNGYTIRGLGLDKTGQIFYRVNTAFLTSGSDYQDLGDALPAACQSLIGTAGITVSDCDEVVKAVKATEMEQQPLVAAAPEAAMCAAGRYVNDLFYDNLENVASGNWVSAAVSGTVNAWYYPQQSAPLTLTQQIGGASYATSGKNNFWGYDQGDGNPGDYAIAMTRDIPLSGQTFFYFRHAYDFDTAYNDNTRAYDVYNDGGVVEYSLDGGATWKDAGPLFDENGYSATLATNSDNPLRGRAAFGGWSNGYTSSRIDLSSLAGQSARFRFRIGTNSTGSWYGWFIDDIRIYTCSDTPPASQATVAFSSSAMRVGRDAGMVQLPVTLSSAVPVTVTVRYSVSGTAVAGKDFALTNDALTFPPNTTTQNIPIAIVNDPDSPADRAIVLTLYDPQQASLGAVASMTLTISNNKLRTYLPLLGR